MAQENDLILSVLRTLISQEFDEMKGKIPYFFETHTPISVEKLLKTTNFDELLNAVEKNTILRYSETLLYEKPRNDSLPRY